MPTPDPHTQSEVPSHKLNPDPRPKSDCAVCTSSLCDISGCMALEREAITTGAPVATNDKQAAELQQWGVWNTRSKAWAYVADHEYGAASENVASCERHRLNKLHGSTDLFEIHPYCESGPYPTPTPRPTPGGEWKAEWDAMLGDWTVSGGKECVHSIICESDLCAGWLATRLNAADAMEAENKRLRRLLELAAMMSDSKADTLKTWSMFQDAGYEQREDKREGFTEFLHREIAAALRGGKS